MYQVDQNVRTCLFGLRAIVSRCPVATSGTPQRWRSPKLVDLFVHVYLRDGGIAKKGTRAARSAPFSIAHNETRLPLNHDVNFAYARGMQMLAVQVTSSQI